MDDYACYSAQAEQETGLVSLYKDVDGNIVRCTAVGERQWLEAEYCWPDRKFHDKPVVEFIETRRTGDGRYQTMNDFHSRITYDKPYTAADFANDMKQIRQDITNLLING